MAVKDVNGTEFNKVIAQNKAVLVDFYAEWCGPCKILAPIIESISNSKPEVVFIKVDVDKEKDAAAALKIQAMPTVVLFVDGKPVDRIVGYKPKEQIVRFIEMYV